MATIVHRYLSEACERWWDKEVWFVGSFPSVLVREYFGRIDPERDVNYFYGSAVNRFWPTLASILCRHGKLKDLGLPTGWNNPEAVRARESLLDLLDVGITDLYAEVESMGRSTDEKIIPRRWNPFLPEILKKSRVLCVTSLAVKQALARYGGHGSATLVVLPSPSPMSRRAGYTDEVLREVYDRLLTPYCAGLGGHHFTHIPPCP